jgi:hypothetical protein
MEYFEKWRAGSAYSLSDKIYVLTIFISETDWIYDEKIKLYNKLFEAQNWLIKEAKKYSQNIKFEGGHFGLDKTVIVDNIQEGTGSGNEPVDIVSSILNKVGYQRNLDFVNWVHQNTDCKNSLVLIFANKKGIGYAMQYNNEMDKEKYFLEGCILFKQYFDGRELASASIAHEFLHLFGAWDLYKTFQQTKDKEKKARKYFQNDIMLRTSYNINELEIGKLTAWLVGLSSYKEEWYEWFCPKNKECL